VAHAQAAVLHVEETTTGLNHRKILMWTFLGSECFFFGSLIASYMSYRGRSIEGPVPGEMFSIPFTSVSTFVLLMSSLFMVLALAAIQRGDRRGTLAWLAATALAGTTFLGGQYYEFTTFYREGLWLGTNLFGTTFYPLVGLHASHVILGLVMLSLCVALACSGALRAHAERVELVSWYWHFVDGVWVVVFTVVYVVGR
jgi:cytochrome c oxidase subunit 3/cytochrome o ubiquinol oxidase subunit 3